MTGGTGGEEEDSDEEGEYSHQEEKIAKYKSNIVFLSENYEKL